tara:strand:- start:5908 stop:7203 length:1296 start_codon:yes stop_codon:yes gene_type:complete
MKFLSIQEAINKKKGKVAIRGWIYRERSSKDKRFLVVRDSTGDIQCILKQENIPEHMWEEANKLLIESSVIIKGEIYKEPRSHAGYEINVKDLEVVHQAQKYPITKDQSQEFLLDQRHLWIRSKRMTSIMKIRSTVFGAIHEYFRKKGYYEHQSPTLTPNACEGGSTLFPVNYFNKELFLTQTWQLYAEAMIFSLEKIYTVAPCFRAEKSKTSRHLTEFWMNEMEVAWMDLDGLLKEGEGLLKYIVKKVLDNNKPELEILERDILKLRNVLEKPFVRMTYDEALDILAKKCKMKVKWGKDLRTIEEDKLSQLYDAPIFITRYPKEVKAFYMKEDPENNNVVLCFDCIAPEGYGEIIGASEREPRVEELIRKLKAEKEDPKNYDWYLDTRRFGSIPHSGFGMGVERVVAWITGIDNIKDSIAFPRTMLRYTP